MGKIVPKKKFFKSAIYTPKLNVGSHIDNVRHSLEYLIFSKEKENESILLKKRVKVVGILTILFMIVGSVLSPKGKAEVVTFYPTACLGGWNNPRNAEGAPQTKSNDNEDEFTSDNSATLPANTSADIYCGNFIGQIEQNTKPTKIIVTLALSKGKEIVLEQKIVGDSFASSSGAILDSTSTAGVSFTLASGTSATSSLSEQKNNATTTESLKESSIVNQVLNAVENTLGKLFGNSDITSSSTQPSPSVNVTGNTSTQGTSSTETSTSTTIPVPTPTPTTSEPATTSVPTLEPPIPTPVVPSPEPTSVPAPATESTTTSFLNSTLDTMITFFFEKVFAVEVASSTEVVVTETPVVIADTKQDSSSTPTVMKTAVEKPAEPPVEAVAASSSEITTSEISVATTSESTSTLLVSSTTEATSTSSSSEMIPSIIINGNAEDESVNNFLEVLYTFDGVIWKSLGKINEDSVKYRTFEIPVGATTSWSDMGQLQIKLQKIARVDPTPTMYLDGIKVEVLYETPVIHEHPDFTRDTLLKDKTDDGVRIVNTINSDTNAHEIWYTTVTEQGNYGVAPGSWVQVISDQPNIPYTFIDIYGQNIFLIDDVQKLLWVKNLQKETNDGVNLIADGTTTTQFSKSNGEEWIFEYNSVTKTGVARIKQ